MKSLFRLPGRRAALAIALSASVWGLPASAQQDAGFGKDIPLGSAVKQIVPEGYAVKFGDGVDQGKPVAWNGGGWSTAIKSAAKSAGYSASINGQTVTITAMPRATAAVEPADAPAPAEPRKVSKAHGRSHAVRHARAEPAPPRRAKAPETEAVVVTDEQVSGGGFVLVSGHKAPAPASAVAAAGEDGWQSYKSKGATPAPAAWTALQGSNLQNVLSEWAAKAGWKVVWESEFQYRLTSSAKFSGGFVEAAGELVKSMSSVRPALNASFYEGNKVLVVGNEIHGDVN